MDTKDKVAEMVANTIKARAEEFKHLLGKEVTVINSIGSLRHIFTGVVFEAGAKIIQEFDSFLHGQLMSGRIQVEHDGVVYGGAAPVYKLNGEGSGTGGSSDDEPKVKQVIEPEPPKEPETPQEPEQPKEPEPAPETPAAAGAAAAKSILKPKAAQ